MSASNGLTRPMRILPSLGRVSRLPVESKLAIIKVMQDGEESIGRPRNEQAKDRSGHTDDQ